MSDADAVYPQCPSLSQQGCFLCRTQSDADSQLTDCSRGSYNKQTPLAEPRSSAQLGPDRLGYVLCNEHY